MSNNIPKTIYAKNFKPSDYSIKKASLNFEIFDSHTAVTSKLQIIRTTKNKKSPLILDGNELSLEYIKLDDIELNNKEYIIDKETLTIKKVPDKFILETKVRINPQENTSLSGLYQTEQNLCTQCEPLGFRKITYFIDRPDILTEFSTTITAEKNKYPVLLSNGNLINKNDIANGRHLVTWHDPSFKPAYLFALVAGKYSVLEDFFITASGKKVTLQIYATPQNIDKCHHAMHSLKQAMLFDEKMYNCEYDLDIYMLVAIDDLNAGAMENKGLNVFNSDFILATPDTATDSDYIKISAVIAHEYFHNWTGNRITCRDWFQLGLKEGVTTFREQQFSEAIFPKAIQRINQIKLIKSRQFVEDSSPLAHPVRLKSYIAITNFYTLTVYYKSAEIARMLCTIVGEKTFRKIMIAFFKRFDGRAVTIEDFLDTAHQVSHLDLGQFKLWYDQKGTPEVAIKTNYNTKKKSLTLIAKQSSPFKKQKPFYIPIAIGAISKNGQAIKLKNKNTRNDILILKKSVERFVFDKLDTKPILSLFRNFSAPIKSNFKYSEEELLDLIKYDSDQVNRWSASQRLLTNSILKLYKSFSSRSSLEIDKTLVVAFREILTNSNIDQALKAQMLQFPLEGYLFDILNKIDIERLAKVLDFLKNSLAQKLQKEFITCYLENHEIKQYDLDIGSIGKRSLKNTILQYLILLDNKNIINICLDQLNSATNLTDTLGSLTALSNSKFFDATKLLNKYYEKWKGNQNLIGKWLALNASIRLPSALKNIKRLTAHPAFNIKNPNKVLALLRTFAELNPFNFHEKNGKAYKFLADKIIEIDSLNPQLAVSIGTSLTRFNKFDKKRQKLIKLQLKRILNTPNISKNLFEILSKAIL